MTTTHAATSQADGYANEALDEYVRRLIAEWAGLPPSLVAHETPLAAVFAPLSDTPNERKALNVFLRDELGVALQADVLARCQTVGDVVTAFVSLPSEQIGG